MRCRPFVVSAGTGGPRLHASGRRYRYKKNKTLGHQAAILPPRKHKTKGKDYIYQRAHELTNTCMTQHRPLEQRTWQIIGHSPELCALNVHDSHGQPWIGKSCHSGNRGRRDCLPHMVASHSAADGTDNP